MVVPHALHGRSAQPETRRCALADDRKLYVARPEDVALLETHWNRANDGDAQFVRLRAPFGGGRRALAGALFRSIRANNDEVMFWRVACSDQENGLQWLVRMYGALTAQLTSDVLRRGKAEMVLNSQLPSQTKRVQGWYQSFVTGLKESKTDAETGQVQLRIPQDNPLLGLIEVVVALSRKMPIVLDLQTPYATNSVLMAQFLESLLIEARNNSSRLFVLLQDEPDGPMVDGAHPQPLRDFYTRQSELISVVDLAPWSSAEVSAYLESKELPTDNAARLAEIVDGRPGFLSELVDILSDRDMLKADLSEVTLAGLVPLDVDTDELELPDTEPKEGERTHAGPDDAGRVAYLAALLGQAFPSNLVADMGGFDRQSIDDLLDAMDGLFEEVQYSEELKTWLYKFTRGSWREGVLQRNADEASTEVAKRVAGFVEQVLVPRGYGFIAKASQMYADAGVPDRAMAMRAMGLSNDAPDAWGMSYDLIRYYDEVQWPVAMRKSVYTSLLERLATAGDVNQADRVHSDVSAWAAEQDDRELTAWLLFNGSRLDMRRQDMFRAKDRARDALKMYESMGSVMQQGEVLNHLASIELQEGNPNASLEHANKALEVTSREAEDGKRIVPPRILARHQFFHGVVARRAQKLDEAIKHFKTANEVAGRTGIANLALDAGLALGEALLVARKLEEARDVLRRVVKVTQQMQSLPRERNACELLAQAEGALRNPQQALVLASRTLQISQQLKLEAAMPIDLYNVGFFNLALNKASEALPFFTAARDAIARHSDHPLHKDLGYHLGVAHMQTGDADSARSAFSGALPRLQAARDLPKLMATLDALGTIEANAGNKDGARQHLSQAIEIANQANLKDQRRALKKKLESLG